MTVVKEIPSIIVSGNGSKTGYTFPFSFSETTEIKVFFTPATGVERELGQAEYVLTPNVAKIGGVISFNTITPSTNEIVRIERVTAIDQKIDYDGTGTVTPEDIEFSLDKLTRICQELFGDVVAILDSKLPDPSLQGFGRILVSDGLNSFTFFPLRLSLPTVADDQKILVVDFHNGVLKYLSAPSITNPVIPQPSQTHEFQLLGSIDGSYSLGATIPVLTPLDSLKVLQWDGQKYIAVPATGLNNPPIAQPTGANLVLTSKSDGSGGWVSEWVDDSYKMEETSSGVSSPLIIVKNTATSINITAGRVLISENVTNNPEVKEFIFAGKNNIPIDTSVGRSKFIYLDFTDPNNPIVTVETIYSDPSRGPKIYIGEVEHTRENSISYIANKFTVVNNIPHMLKNLYMYFVRNFIQGQTIAPVSTIAGNAGSNKMQISTGTFIGYDVNVDIDPLNPHIRTGLQAQNPASFRWRSLSGADSTPAQTEFIAGNLKITDSNGALTTIQNNHFAQTLIWRYPDGQIIIEYPRLEVVQKADLKDIGTFVSQFIIKSPETLKRNAALIGYLQLKQGSDFSDTINFFITNLAGQIVQSGGTISDRVPFPTPADAGKPLVATTTGSWGIAPYNLPSPAGQADGKSIVVSNNNYIISDASDPVARLLEDNGVVDGFKFTAVSTGNVLTISAGKALFFEAGTAGIQPASQPKVVDFAGGTYTITGIANRNISYINISSAGILSESDLPNPNTRGNSITLFRVEHFNKVDIEDIQAVYRVETCLPEQVKEIYEQIGKSIKNFSVTVKTDFQLKTSNGILYGFDSGAQVDILKPHKNIIVGQDPLSFKFSQTDGTESGLLTDFPAIPKVELSPNVLTDLQAGKVGYYPVFIYSDGYVLIEYSKQELDPSNLISVSDYERSYIFDPEIIEGSWFIGWIKWEFGKTFNTGNIFVPVGSNAVTGGGGVPVVSTAGASEGDVLVLDASKNPVWDTLIPVPDQANAGKIAVFDPQGRIIAGSTVPVSGGGLGRHLVATNGMGGLEAISNSSDYVDPSIWSISDLQLHTPYPIPKTFARKGVGVSKFTRNDSGGGGLRYYKVAEVFSDGFTNMSSATGTPNPNQRDYPQSFMLPFFTNPSDFTTSIDIQNQTKIDTVLARIKSFLPVQNQNVFGKPSIAKTNTLTTCAFEPKTEPSEYFRDISNSEVNLFIRRSNLNTLLISNQMEFLNNQSITLNNISFLTNTADATFSTNIFDYNPTKRIVSFALNGLFFNSDKDINVNLTVNSVSLKIKSLNLSLQDLSGFKLFIYFPSNQNPTESIEINVAPLFNPPTTDQYGITLWSLQNHAINKSSSFNLTDSTVFLSKDVTSNHKFLGYFFRPIGSSSRKSFSLDEINLNCSFTFSKIFGVNNNTGHSRFEYTTLASISNTPDEQSKIITGAGNPLKPGKILILYSLLFPVLPKTFADFDQNHEGIIINPFKLSTIPQIYLENQSGQTKWTERVEAVRRKGKSPLFEVYELDCTPEQFNNWKVVIYIENPFNLAEAAQKIIMDKLGAFLWFGNEEDLPA